MDKTDWAFATFLMLMSGLLGLVIGLGLAVEAQQHQAIEAGVGYWEQIDNGPETRFVYGVKPEGEGKSNAK